jgi:hypothetical protein
MHSEIGIFGIKSERNDAVILLHPIEIESVAAEAANRLSNFLS